MIRGIATLLVIALVGWVGVVSAQQAAPPAAAPAAGEKMMEGKVKAVDQAKKQVTLEDGTSFTIPATVQVEWATITPGKTVAISYVEAGQMKTVRKVEVKS
jgi:uncharacterized membrane protein